MYLKILGFSLIVIAGIVFSLKTKKEYCGRIKEIELLIKVFEILKTEIGFLRTPIDIIVKKLIDSCSGNFKNIFINIKDLLEDGYSIKAAWQDSIYKHKDKLFLEEKDVEIFLSFGNIIGMTDWENQVNNINAYKGRMEVQLGEAKQKQAKNEKTKSSLIISSSVALAIILL